MKKVLNLIITILICIPLIVSADMGAPMTMPYEAEVTNPDGAAIYEWDTSTNAYIETDKKIENHKKVKVNYEMDTFAICDDGSQIKLADITLVEKEYKLDERNLTEKTDALAIKDIEMKKGPASLYSSTGVTIKSGEKLKIRFFKDTLAQSPWVYAEYNGAIGYINTISASVAYEYTREPVIINRDTDLLDKNNKTISKIEANTKISSGYYRVDPWSHMYYLEYNGTYGLVDEFYVSTIEKNIIYKTKRELNLYKTAEDNAQIVGTVPKDTTIKNAFVTITYDSIKIYYENGSQSGWIFSNIDDETVEQTEVEPEKEQENEENNSDKETAINYKEYILIILAVAIILSLTAIVTILLINKTKKNS